MHIRQGKGGVLMKVVDANVSHIQVWNSSNYESTMPAGTAMGAITELEIAGRYKIDSVPELAAIFASPNLMELI
jgi:hypothetical protein